jgi:hypothetical protein
LTDLKTHRRNKLQEKLDQSKEMNSTENNNSSEVVVQASTQKKRIAVINLGSLLQIHTKKIKMKT